jgi:hypothetical protein
VAPVAMVALAFVERSLFLLEDQMVAMVGMEEISTFKLMKELILLSIFEVKKSIKQQMVRLEAAHKDMALTARTLL